MNEYLKLKEKQDKQNKYFYNYVKNKIKTAKETNQEEYKKIMAKQNEANKKYKNEALKKLKEDPVKYKEFREKDVLYRRQLKERKTKQQQEQEQPKI